MSASGLSDAQREALQDLAQGPLVRTVAGWGRDGSARWHRAGTVDALERKGMCAIANRHRLSRAVKGTATITAAGRAEASIGASS